MASPDDFPDVHDDAFMDEDPNADILDEAGASPLNPHSDKRPSRKGIFLILGAIVLLAGTLGIGVRAFTSGETSTANRTASEVEVAQAEIEEGTDADGLVSVPENIGDARSGQRTSSLTGDYEFDLDRDVSSTEDPWGDWDAEESQDQEPESIPDNELTEPDPPLEAPSPETQPQPQEPEVDYAALFEQRQLEEEEREARRREEEQRMAEVHQARERLHDQGGTMLLRDESARTASEGGASPYDGTRELLSSIPEEYRDEHQSDFAEIERMLDSFDQAATAADAPGGPGFPVGSRLDIVPGTRIPAVMESEFRSDEMGAGSVQATLSAPVRQGNNIILPAGTRAFGEARATGGTRPGQEARVAIEFTTFVTPRNQVYRNAVDAVATDPVTLAHSVKGEVDRNFLGNITRGAAATAIDFWLTQGSRPVGYMQEPSQRDLAASAARQRTRNIIEGPVGDESTERPTVYLPSDREILITFGITNR